MSRIIQYFFPKRKLHAIPKSITADYNRGAITREQAILMMSGDARDPEEARQLYEALKEKHGDSAWRHVNFYVRRQRTQTFSERLMMLMRKIMGEDEKPNLRQRKVEAIVGMDYNWRSDDS